MRIFETEQGAAFCGTRLRSEFRAGRLRDLRKRCFWKHAGVLERQTGRFECFRQRDELAPASPETLWSACLVPTRPAPPEP